MRRLDASMQCILHLLYPLERVLLDACCRNAVYRSSDLATGTIIKYKYDHIKFKNSNSVSIQQKL